MKKCLYVLPLALAVLVAACSPAVFWPLEVQVVVDAASLEGMPEGIEGTITCDLTYDPGELLCMALNNGTDQHISTYVAGELYRRNENGHWIKEGNEDVWMPLTAYIHFPGSSSNPIYAIGLENAPTLESGEYKFVLGASCGRTNFDLTVPFAVP